MAIITGKNLIKKEQQANQLFIFKKQENKEGAISFVQEVRVILLDLDQFKQEKTCTVFYFKNDNSRIRDTLLFAFKDKIISLNFNNWMIKTVATFEVPLDQQPRFFEVNDAQTIYIVSTQQECIYVNTELNKQVDMDEAFLIKDIKFVKYDNDDNSFYILCNKYKEKLGFYLLKTDADRPLKHRFIIKWKNKLDIEDTNVFKLLDSNRGYKELCVSYKSIYINTYSIMVIDIGS